MQTAVARIVPWILCVLIYWPGLRAWFQMDDFAWLSLHLQVQDFGSFVTAMVQPLAQGTIRPWSERLFFFLGWQFFGMEAAPYRAVAFATMFANLWLLGTVTRKLTASRVAAFAAPVLWVCSGNLYTPMSWTSAYNQILCATFLLTALLLWIRYTETSETRWYVWQFVVFVLGFGALEINLVYPALAALHAFCFARRHLWRTVPMFAVSVLFVVAHRLAAPAQRSDVYRMYFDPATALDGLATFFVWSVSAHRYADFRGLEVWPFVVCAVIAGAALLLVCIRRDLMPLFCVGWFVAVLAPVLPLRNHRSDYYLTIPVIGLAILGAYGITRARGPWRGFAVVAVLAYAIPNAWMGHGMSRLFYEHSTRVKHFVRSVAGAARQHPGDALLISGMKNDLFWRGYYDPVFRALELPHVYLTSDTKANIERTRVSGELGQFFLADTVAASLLKQNKARAYELRPDGRLRDVTAVTRATLERSTNAGPAYLDVRSPVSSAHIGEGWWPAEPTHRWMSKRAAVELRGPLKAPGELVLRGFVTPGHLQSGPLRLTVTADGTRLPASVIDERNQQFELRLPLPQDVTGKPLMKVEVEVDRPLFIPSDGRNLGAAFGTFQVVP